MLSTGKVASGDSVKLSEAVATPASKSADILHRLIYIAAATFPSFWSVNSRVTGNVTVSDLNRQILERKAQFLSDPILARQVAVDLGAIVAIEGQAKTGKTTLQELMSNHYGIFPITSGNLFRGATFAARESFASDIDPQEITAIADRLATVGTTKVFSAIAAANLHLKQLPRADGKGYEICTFLEGRDISALIKESDVGELTSLFISQIPTVREILTDKQRSLITEHEAVFLEGRASYEEVIKPYAESLSKRRGSNVPVLKIWLTADEIVRAKRDIIRKFNIKFNDHNKPIGITDSQYASYLRAALIDLRQRDSRDENRALFPNKMSNGAIVIDSTDHTNLAATFTILNNIYCEFLAVSEFEKSIS